MQNLRGRDNRPSKAPAVLVFTLQILAKTAARARKVRFGLRATVFRQIDAATSMPLLDVFERRKAASIAIQNVDT